MKTRSDRGRVVGRGETCYDRRLNRLPTKDLGRNPMSICRFMCVVAAVVFAGCSPKVNAPQEEPTGSGLPGSPLAPVESVVEFGIGDVETSILINVTMDESMNSATLHFEEVETKKYEIAIVRVAVAKPYPESLPVIVRLRRWEGFVGHEVQVKPRLYIGEDTVIDLDAFLFGNGVGSSIRETTVDLMEHLDEVPESLLVRVEADLNLFLDGADSGITIESPTTPETQSVVRLSNPMRIIFS